MFKNYSLIQACLFHTKMDHSFVSNKVLWGAAICYGPHAKMPKSRRKHFGNSCFRHCFFIDFWSKLVPRPPGSLADHFDQVWTSPDLTRPMSHLIFKNYQKFILKTTSCFLFLGGIKPQDHAHWHENHDGSAVSLNESSVRQNPISLVTQHNSCISFLLHTRRAQDP